MHLSKASIFTPISWFALVIVDLQKRKIIQENDARKCFFFAFYINIFEVVVPPTKKKCKKTSQPICTKNLRRFEKKIISKEKNKQKPITKKNESKKNIYTRGILHISLNWKINLKKKIIWKTFQTTTNQFNWLLEFIFLSIK